MALAAICIRSRCHSCERLHRIVPYNGILSTETFTVTLGGMASLPPHLFAAVCE